jgi:hypothetical protein
MVLGELDITVKEKIINKGLDNKNNDIRRTN